MKPASLLLLLMVIKICQQRRDFRPDDQHSRMSLVQCLLNTGTRFFKKGEILIYSISLKEDGVSTMTKLNSLLIPSLMDLNYWSIMVKNVQHDQLFLEPKNQQPHNYLIQVRYRDEFASIIHKMRTFVNWNPHAKFVVFSTTVFKEPAEMAAEIMQDFWRANVLKGVVFLVDRFDTSLVNIYTWYPYENGNCGDNFTMKPIDSCRFGTIVQNSDWFDEKIPKKFNECIVKVRAIEYPPFIIGTPNGTIGTNNDYLINRGLEVNLLDTIAKVFNLKMLYRYSDVDQVWGQVLANGSATGSLALLRAGLDDVAIGSYVTTLRRAWVFDLSIPYYQESLHFCVPHMPKFRSFIQVINLRALCIIVLIYFVSSATIWLFSSRNFFNNCSLTFQNASLLLLGLPIGLVPKTGRLRLIVLVLLLGSMCILTAYRTLLITALTNADYDEEIQTIEDIVRLKLRLFGVANYLKYFEDNEEIVKLWENCTNLKKCLGTVATGKTSAMCVAESYLDYIVPKDNRLLYCFQDVAVSTPVVVLMRKGFPLHAQFNLLISRILEGGLIAKWEKDIRRVQFESFIKTNASVLIDNRNNLDLYSLRWMFGLWIIGCAVGLVVLGMEVLYCNFTRHQFCE